MSIPYWCCSDCYRNTEIPEEVLLKFRQKKGSFNDLMTCKHCGSTPEKRKERMEKRWARRKELISKIKPREHPSDRYRRWWVGKLCRLAHSGADFKRVKDVKFMGPPSGFSGWATLVYEDGAEELVKMGPKAYKPRKKDVEVLSGRGEVS